MLILSWTLLCPWNVFNLIFIVTQAINPLHMLLTAYLIYKKNPQRNIFADFSTAIFKQIPHTNPILFWCHLGFFSFFRGATLACNNPDLVCYREHKSIKNFMWALLQCSIRFLPPIGSYLGFLQFFKASSLALNRSWYFMS